MSTHEPDLSSTLCRRAAHFYKETLPYHFANSLAQLTVATPIFALYETAVAGMTPEQSINTRAWAAAITLSGVGYLDAKWRDWVREKRGIEDDGNSDEKKLRRTDKASKIVFNLARATATYLPINPIDILTENAEARDWSKVGRGIGLGVAYGGLFGGWSGYTMDLYRDLTGISESKRIPKSIQKLSKKAKKAVLVGLCATSIGATGIVYKSVPAIQQSLETTIENYKAKHSTNPQGNHPLQPR